MSPYIRSITQSCKQNIDLDTKRGLSSNRQETEPMLYPTPLNNQENKILTTDKSCSKIHIVLKIYQLRRVTASGLQALYSSIIRPPQLKFCTSEQYEVPSPSYNEDRKYENNKLVITPKC